MARLEEIKRNLLKEEDFEKYPVWTWDDEMENLHPISEEQPLLKEYGYLFVKSIFYSRERVFGGYLMFLAGYGVYAFCFIIGDLEYIFNQNAKTHNQEKLDALIKHLDCSPFNLFPLRYESDVLLKETGKIEGTLDFR